MKRSVWDKKRIYRVLSVIFILAVFCGTLIFTVRSDGAKNILFILKNADLRWASLGLILMFSEIILDSAGLFVPMIKNGERAGFFTVVKSAFIGRFFSYITPFNTGGQPAQAYFLSKKGARMSGTLSLLLIKCIIYQIALLSFSALLFILNRTFFLETFSGYVWLVALGLLINLPVTAAMIFIGKHASAASGILSFILRILKVPQEKIDRAEGSISHFEKQFAETGCSKSTLLKMYALALLQVLSGLSVTYAVCRAFGLRGASFFGILTVQIFLSQLIAYVPTPGAGIGAEGAFFLFFSGIFLSEVHMANLFWRILTFYIPFILGGILSIPQWKNATRQQDTFRSHHASQPFYDRP